MATKTGIMARITRIWDWIIFPIACFAACAAVVSTVVLLNTSDVYNVEELRFDTNYVMPLSLSTGAAYYATYSSPNTAPTTFETVVIITKRHQITTTITAHSVVHAVGSLQVSSKEPLTIQTVNLGTTVVEVSESVTVESSQETTSIPAASTMQEPTLSSFSSGSPLLPSPPASTTEAQSISTQASSSSPAAASSVLSSSSNTRSNTFGTSTLSAASTPTQAVSTSQKSSKGPIIGGVIGGLAVLLLLASVLFCYIRKRRNTAAKARKPNIQITGGGPMGAPPTPRTAHTAASDSNPSATSPPSTAPMNILKGSRNSQSWKGPPANAPYSTSPSTSEGRPTSAEEHARFAAYNKPPPPVPGSPTSTATTPSYVLPIPSNAPFDGLPALNDSSQRSTPPVRPPRPDSLDLDANYHAHRDHLENYYGDATTLTGEDHDERYNSLGATPYPRSSRYSVASDGFSGISSPSSPNGSRQWGTPSINEQLMGSSAYRRISPPPLNIVKQEVTEEDDTFDAGLATQSAALHSSKAPAQTRVVRSVYSRQIDGFTLNALEGPAPKN